MIVDLGKSAAELEVYHINTTLIVRTKLEIAHRFISCSVVGSGYACIRVSGGGELLISNSILSTTSSSNVGVFIFAFGRVEIHNSTLTNIHAVSTTYTSCILYT